MDKQKPLVTVLMPVYNAERFLTAAIDSILQQTLWNFEFLIINDGSKDSTVSIIESYNDPRIKLVHNEENLGISATLNKGILLAGSDLIARMDADDISYPQRLQKQYQLMIANPDCAMVSSYTNVISEQGPFIKSEVSRDRMLYYNLHFECSIYHPTVMFRRNCVAAVNMYDIPYAEDFNLFWKLANKYRIRQIEEVLLDYRISGNSTHLVHKRKEYDEAIFYVLRRNLNYYFRKPVKISDEYLYALRYDFEPILKHRNFLTLVRYMYWLKKISKKIIAHPNPNNIGNNVLNAYQNKVRFTFIFVKPYLSVYKWVFLMLLTGSFSFFLKQIKMRFRM